MLQARIQSNITQCDNANSRPKRECRKFNHTFPHFFKFLDPPMTVLIITMPFHVEQKVNPKSMSDDIYSDGNSGAWISIGTTPDVSTVGPTIAAN